MDTELESLNKKYMELQSMNVLQFFSKYRLNNCDKYHVIDAVLSCAQAVLNDCKERRESQNKDKPDNLDSRIIAQNINFIQFCFDLCEILIQESSNVMSQIDAAQVMIKLDMLGYCDDKYPYLDEMLEKTLESRNCIEDIMKPVDRNNSLFKYLLI